MVLKPLVAAIALALGVVLIGGPACRAAAETRAAVVVGNAGYSGAALENPGNDARLMAQTLQELGFDVALYQDVTTAQAPLLAKEITRRLAAADVGILYYAGHGLQLDGQNLLLPVDTDLTSVTGIAASGVPLSTLLRALTSGARGIKIVILDACRNSLVPAGQEDLKSGFSFVEAPSGEVLIAFSTGAGEVAFDSSGGTNSPYTAALANALQESGSDIYDVFRSVRRAVRSGTGGRQIPWITGSIETDYIFRPAAAVATPATPGAAPGVAEVVTASGEVLTIDRILWEYLEPSSNPQDFAEFAEVFPASPFAPLAKDREVQHLAADEGSTLTRGGVDLSPQAISDEVQAALAGTPEAAGRASLLLDQSGSYVMRDSFRTWPLSLPATEAGLAAIATTCDEEAADPVDPEKLSPGISDSFINVRRALRACAFDLATDPENPRLLFQFARILDTAKRHDWANAYYERAVALGYGAAMVNRGTNARLGRGGERDFALAYTLYRAAAVVGNPRARVNLARAYQLGEGAPADPQEAVLWARLGASMGWPHAVNYLGDLYSGGIGVEKDPVEAAELYRMSAAQGQTTGMANLGVAYLNGAGVARDEALGLEWLDRALNLGNGFAPVYAGRFYLKGGEVVPADPERARALFEAATRRGNAIGYLELANGYADGRFAGGENPAEAYRNALFAKEGRVGGAEDLVARLEAALAPETRAAIQDEVALFIRQNGL